MFVVEENQSMKYCMNEKQQLDDCGENIFQKRISHSNLIQEQQQYQQCQYSCDSQSQERDFYAYFSQVWKDFDDCYLKPMLTKSKFDC